MEIRRRHAVHYAKRRTSCLFNQSEQIRLATSTHSSRTWHRFCVFPRARRHRLHTFPRLATYDWFFVLLACFVIWRLNCQGVVGKWKPLQNRLHLTWIYSAIFKPLAQKQSMTFVFSLYTAFCSRMINIHHVCLLIAIQQHFWLFSPTAHCLRLWLFIVEGTIVW